MDDPTDKTPVVLPPLTSTELPKSMQPADGHLTPEWVINLRWEAALKLRERLGSHYFYGGKALRYRTTEGEESEKDYWYSMVRSLKVK